MRILLSIVATALLAIVAAMGSAHFISADRLEMDQWNVAIDHALGRARAFRDGAGPKYQEDVLGALADNPNNGPFFHLEELLADAKVIKEPTTTTGGKDAGVLESFDFDEDFDRGLSAAERADQSRTDLPPFGTAKGRTQLHAKDGILYVTHEEGDYLETATPLTIPKDEVADIVIRARLEKGTEMRLGWPEEARPDKNWKYNVAVDVVPDGEFHTYVINASNALKRGVRFGATLTKLLLKPSNVDGDVVEIDSIRFISKLARYQQAPRGVAHETVGKQMRPVLYMLPPQAIAYDIDVPADRPVLDFGTAVLRSNPAVDFRVRIAGPDTAAEPEPNPDDSPDAAELPLGSEEIYRATCDDMATWSEARIDLARFAGQRVTLTFEVEGGEGNVALWSSPTIHSKPKKRMNVVLIMEDTLRTDHLSLHDYARETSPFKVELAKQSVVFDRAISQATQTRPSVPSLMTSLLPTATGVWHFSDALRDTYITLAEALRSQGFATASFLQNANAGPYVGLHQGFDALYDEELLGKSTEGILGDLLGKWLDHNGDRNFFANIHIVDPHGPYDPPAPYDHWYHAEGKDLGSAGVSVEHKGEFDPEWIEDPTKQSRTTLYDGEIQHNDNLLDGFLAELDRRGLRENTLIIFVSDHGEYLGEDGMWGHHPPGYMTVTNVPLMIAFPQEFPGGRRITWPVQNIDVMPTILELAGIDPGEFLTQGDSLVPLLREGSSTNPSGDAHGEIGAAEERFRNRLVLSEEPTRMMTKGEACGCGSMHFRQWHLINSAVFGRGRLPVPQTYYLEGYDVDADPRERSPMTALRLAPSIGRRFESSLRELQEINIEGWKKMTGGATEMVQSDPDVRERLRALGYVQ